MVKSLSGGLLGEKSAFEFLSSISCSTDNSLMSGVTLSDECRTLHEQTGLTRGRVVQAMLNAAGASFMPAAQHDAAREALARWQAEAGSG